MSPQPRRRSTYRIFEIRAVYSIEDLDAWAATKLSPLRHSTSAMN